MGLKKLIKKVLCKFRKTVLKPVYIPVLRGELLKGKTVLITGGTGGIGSAIAARCAENGAKVIIIGRSLEKLHNIAKRIEAIPYVLDIQDTTNMKNDLERLVSDYKIDVLVNSAGVQKGSSFGSTGEEDFDNTIDTNLKGTYFLSQLFSNYLIQNGVKGNILNISSVSGYRPAISPYMVSKWGITGLTKGMGKKLIKHGIVVNGIAPGPVATEMLGLDGSNLKYDKAPSGRYSDPNEIANLAVFLVSDLGRMIVGETVYITGGCGNLTFDDIDY